MKKENSGRYFQLLLVILAAGAIYPLIYLKTNYQETILEIFEMTLPQLNNIYSFLGVVFIVGYFPSGILSDKFSAKKLLALSLLGTAIGGFWFAQVPGYRFVVIIFCLWGIFAVFTFWSSHLKLVKMLAGNNEEGRFFGILDGGRGVVEALLASFALMIFSKILGDSLNTADKREALVAIIYMYSIVLLVTSILILFLVEDDKKAGKGNQKEKSTSTFRFTDLKDVFKNKYVYLQGGIIFMGYSVFWTVYYLGGFLETNIGMNPVAVGSIMVAVLWMRPVGGFLGGFLADKIGKTATNGGALAGAAICLSLTALLPTSSSPVLFSVLIIFCGIMVYAVRGTYWSLLGQSGIEPTIMGTAIGVISFIGYLPDIILPQINSFLFGTFGDNGGYNAYFLVSALFGLLGVVIIMIYNRLHNIEKSSKEEGQNPLT